MAQSGIHDLGGHSECLAHFGVLSVVARAGWERTLFVANAGNGTIGEYTTSGATVNAALISGLSGLWGMAADGTDICLCSVL